MPRCIFRGCFSPWRELWPAVFLSDAWEIRLWSRSKERADVKDPVELDIGSPITASPLVADIDDDGSNELVVVADRLYCWRLPSLTTLSGYPKRIAGPSASTPVLARSADGKPFLIFGSDDDRLYAVDASGAPIPGFPVATGGDVFTTPLVSNLNNNGGRSVIFGSDDGSLYTMALERT